MNKRLKAKIIEHYGTQFLFAVFVGEHESEISKVIRGRRVLSPEARKKWAGALQISDSDGLFNGEEA